LLWRLLANSEWDESENAVIDLWCGVIEDLDNGRDAVLTKASLVEIKRLCYSFGNGGCLNSPCATNTFAGCWQEVRDSEEEEDGRDEEKDD
jgi:hypothetical protein